MKYIRFGIYILLILFLFFPFLVLPRIIKIKKIECFSQFGKCDDNLDQRLDVLSGKNYNEVKAGIKNIFSSDPTIKDYSWQYLIPDKVRLNVILKKAKFAIRNKESNEIILIDKEGKVLSKERETNLPFLSFSGALPEIGGKVDETQLFALDLLWRLYYLFQVREGELGEDRLEVEFPDNIKAILPLAGDQEIIISSLKLVLSNGAVKGKVIDLRYKNPIIR